MNTEFESEFPIGAALTVAVGSGAKLVCTLEQLYNILGYLTGDVPAAADIDTYIEQCRPWVREQLPWTRSVIPPTGGDAQVLDWLADLTRQHGEFFTLTPLPEGIQP